MKKSKYEGKTRVEKAINFVNYSIAFVICVYYTLKIDIHGAGKCQDSLLSLLVLCVLGVTLVGGALAVFSETVAYIVACVSKGPKPSRGYIPPGFESGTKSAFLAILVATTYSMVLYYVGLTDSFFPALLLGIQLP